MQFTFCPHCGRRLIRKEIGDEGMVPYCESCEIPLWDMFTTSVICAVINEYDEIALLRQEYVSETKFVCVAGVMKPGESAEETAVREIKEEIGQDVEQLQLVRTYPYAKKEMLMIGFQAFVRKSDFKLSDEVNAAVWVPLEEALPKLREGGIAWQLVKSVIEQKNDAQESAFRVADEVKEQYKNAKNLNIRISIHDKYSVNKTGFGNWIFAHYDLKPEMDILELGCGTGEMWKAKFGELSENTHLTLTDFSEGMVDTTRENLGEHDNLNYDIVDIQEIPFADGSFDRVIANMMLYHVPDIDKGLDEVSRVLKQNGVFYCATFGEHGIISYLADILKDYGVKDKTNNGFTLQSGEEILRRHFSVVERYDYEDALEITDIDDMVDYLYSLQSMAKVKPEDRDNIKRALSEHTENGVLKVPKEYGMFICTNQLS